MGKIKRGNIKIKKIKVGKPKVVVIGLGYIGLPTLVAILETGKFKTFGFDINEEKVKKINSGISPIEDEKVKKLIAQKKIKASSKESILRNSDFIITCVPTPVLNDYTPDYNPVISAAKTAAKYLKRGSFFILESTVNPGTCEEIILPLLESGSHLKAGKDFYISHCPERIWPGEKNWDIHNINRNVGSLKLKENKIVAQFYRTFVNQAKVNEVNSLKVAEATKIIENTFRDINIAFVNELAQSFDAMGIDLIETLRAAANKPFGFMAHFPGCGVGGHCIAVDPYYLIRRAGLSGFNHSFVKLAREINNSMPKYTVSKLTKALNEIGLPIKNTKICLLGLSYKPNVGDTRESPSLKIKQLLKDLEANLTAYDPYVKSSDFKNLEDVVKNNTAIIIATAHREIIEELPGLLKKSKIKVIIDGRNCLDKNFIKKLGILYMGIGR